MQSTGVLARWAGAAGAVALLAAGAAWPAATTGDDREVRLSPYRVRPGQDIEIAVPGCGGPVLAHSAAFQDEVRFGDRGFQDDEGFGEDEGFGGEGFGDEGFGEDGPGGFGDGSGGGPPAVGWAQVDYDAPRGAYSVEVDCEGTDDTVYGELYVVDGFGPDTGGGGLALAGRTAHGAVAARETTADPALGWGAGAAAVLAGAGGLILVRRRRAAGRG